MSLLDINLSDVPDEITVEPGEYQLVITKAEQKQSKEGNEMIAVYFNIIDQPDAQMIAHYFLLPTGKGDEKANSKLRRLKDFYVACGFDLAAPIDTADFKGTEVFAILKLEDNDEYGEQNRINRFVVPKD